ncbi:MAG: class I SAM-dependent methyltransferase [Planctomycetaceae bacterium]
MQQPVEPYRKHYDADRAARYAATKDRPTRANRAERALVARAFRHVPAGATVLDAPCGSGRLSAKLALMGYRVAAADVSPAMVELARARFVAEGLAISAEARDLEASGYADRAFDAVFCFRLFHHFPSEELRDRVARELCRIAGRFVLASYLDARSFTCRKRAWQARRRGRAPGKHPETPAAMAARFARCGFRAVADLARFPLVHSLRILVAERRPTAGS